MLTQFVDSFASTADRHVQSTMETDSDLDDDFLQSYSDTELVRCIIDSPSLPSSPGVSLLSSNFIAKHYQPDEVEDMIHATDIAGRLGIRAPNHKEDNQERVERVLYHGPYPRKNARGCMDTSELVHNNKTGPPTPSLCPTSPITHLARGWIAGDGRVPVILARRSLRPARKVQTRGHGILFQVLDQLYIHAKGDANS